MISVTVSRTGNGLYTGFVCSGHAGFANAGKDIVCAAVSILVINTVNAIEELTEQEYSCEARQEDGYIRFRMDEDVLTPESQLLLKAMVLGLGEVEKQYHGKYVKLKFKEV